MEKESQETATEYDGKKKDEQKNLAPPHNSKEEGILKEEEKEKEEKKQDDLDEFQLASLFSDKVLFYIVRVLRNGPIDTRAMHKLIKTKFRRLKRKISEYFDLLIKYNFIRTYSYTKTRPNPDRTPDLYPHMNVGETRTFYLLVKDFYAIRTPPIKILELLEESNIPMKIVKQFRKEVENFFNHYTNKAGSGDDEEVLEIFQDQKLFAVISYLSNKIYKIGDLSGKIKQYWSKEPLKLFKKLEDKDFIKIIEVKETNEKWVVLKTGIELRPVFPEYLIKVLNQKMAEKKLDKDFALLTLNYLKFYYLQLEKPDLLKKFMDKIKELQEKLQPLLDEKVPKEKKVKKKIIKLYSQIIDVYDKMGDVVNREKTKKELDSLLESLEKKNEK